MTDEDTSPEKPYIFFLGAGASIKADVPATRGMLRKFEETLGRDRRTLGEYRRIVRRLEDWASRNNRVADVELVLELLDKLQSPEAEPLTAFYQGGGFVLDVSRIHGIQKKLRNFIKQVGMVAGDKIDYLNPFGRFLVERRSTSPLDVFTVNYDTAIEQFCNIRRLRYVDGFDLEWNPDTFKKPGYDFRLFKLHGSVMWYLTQNGSYVKIPIKTDKAEIELVTREVARPLMIYPARKWQASDPFLELLWQFRGALRNTELVIVVGYSFRDDLIRDVFWNAAQGNRRLRLLFISPSAIKYYDARLRLYPEGEESSLADRVLLLPYCFESVFPVLLEDFIRPYQVALSTERNAMWEAEKGKVADWLTPLLNYSKAEDVFSAERLIPHFNGLVSIANSEIPTRLWIAHWLRGHARQSKVYLNVMLDAFQGSEPDNMRFQPMISPHRFLLSFVDDKKGTREPSGVHEKLVFVDDLLQSRAGLVKHAWQELIAETRSKVAPIKKYLSDWMNDKMTLESWRVRITPDKSVKLAKKFSSITAPPSAAQETAIKGDLLQIEKPIYEAAWRDFQSLKDLSYESPKGTD